MSALDASRTSFDEMRTDDPVYLDHNATTPLLPEVVDAMLPYLREHFGNPSSGHAFGRRAHEAVERARAQVASLLGCGQEELVFTSGGTEANNLAICGVMEALGHEGRVVTSIIEHPATEQPCAWLERRGTPVERLAVDAHGRVRLDEAESAVTPGTALVTVMHANNETGVLQPIEALARLAREVGAVVHTGRVGRRRAGRRGRGRAHLRVAAHRRATVTAAAGWSRGEIVLLQPVPEL